MGRSTFNQSALIEPRNNDDHQKYQQHSPKERNKRCAETSCCKTKKVIDYTSTSENKTAISANDDVNCEPIAVSDASHLFLWI